MPKVLIVQEYIPHYRVKFFEDLIEHCGREGISVELVVTGNDEVKARRLGQGGSLGSVSRARQYSIRIKGKTVLTYQACFRRSRRYDLVIVEQANRHLLNLCFIFGRAFNRTPQLAFWGHGFDHQHRAGPLRRAFKNMLLRRSDWWFAYTEAVADYLVSLRYPRERITTVNNTIDTRELTGQLDLVRPLYQRNKDQVLFLGGLYADKGIDYVLQVARALREIDGQVHMVIAGEGELRAKVESETASNPRLSYVGDAYGHQRARLLVESSVIIMPRMVGLVAIDSLVAERPIVAVQGDSHSPEFAYLSEKCSLILATNTTPTEFAEQVVSLLKDEDHLSSLMAECGMLARKFSLDKMVDAFSQGILKSLTAER